MGVGGWKGARQPGMEYGGARWDSGDGPRECLGPAQASPGRTVTGMGTGKGGQARHACRRGNYTVAVRYSRLPRGKKKNQDCVSRDPGFRSDLVRARARRGKGKHQPDGGYHEGLNLALLSVSPSLCLCISFTASTEMRWQAELSSDLLIERPSEGKLGAVRNAPVARIGVARPSKKRDNEVRGQVLGGRQWPTTRGGGARGPRWCGNELLEIHNHPTQCMN